MLGGDQQKMPPLRLAAAFEFIEAAACDVEKSIVHGVLGEAVIREHGIGDGQHLAAVVKIQPFAETPLLLIFDKGEKRYHLPVRASVFGRISLFERSLTQAGGVFKGPENIMFFS